jgi:hypothetical protein
MLKKIVSGSSTSPPKTELPRNEDNRAAQNSTKSANDKIVLLTAFSQDDDRRTNN